MRTRWNHNLHYHDLVLSTMPSPCHAALDVGCGDGTFVRRLIERAGSVVGIDTSAPMIEQARRDAPAARVTLINDDFLAHDFAGLRFDFVTCIAAAHHMDYRAALERMKALLQPGGRVAILGLARASTLTDVAFSAAGMVTSRLHRLLQASYDPRAPVAVPELTYAGVQRIASAVLPGAAFRRLVLFRYLLTWTSPGG
jgi:ubiquinone/menaquinone biosynthesis C-methylase UbiE